WGTAASAPSEAPPYLPAQTQPAAIPEAAGAPERIRVPRDAVKTNADAMPVDPAVPELIRVPPRPRAENSPAGAAAGKKEEGGKVFARACASCHGDHGQGGRYGGKTDGRSVGAINHPDFLALISDQALRRFVITGRPDFGMPDYADPRGRPEGFQ